MFKFFKIFPNHFKKNIYIFIILNFFSVAIESLGIGLVLPLLHSLVNPNNFFFEHIENYLPNLSSSESLKILLLIFLVVFVIKNLFLLFFRWWQAYFVNSIQHFLQNSLLKRYLSDELLSINRLNVGVKIRNIKSETSRFAKFLLSWMGMMIESFMIIGLLSIVFISNYKIALFSIFLFAFFLSIYLFLSKILAYKWAEKKLNLSEKSMLFLNESLKFIKDIRLFNKKNYFLRGFEDNEKKIFNLSTKFSAFNSTPRILIEILIIFLLVSYIYVFLKSDNNLNLIIVNVGFYFVIALRFYPACSKIFSCINEIRSSSPSIDLLYNEINHLSESSYKPQEENISSKFNFKNEIKCENFSYTYHNKEIIFHKANIVIKKNEKILLMSPSGKGKSTFLDILSGLIKVDKGCIFYDDFDIVNNPSLIQNTIGYLSQESFILNESLLFNITFENDENNIDKKLIDKVIKLTKLHKIFSDEILDLNFQINENGSNLSGGQKQRISLCRVLYKNPDILILDEPTNEIDGLSENDIIRSINDTFLNKTVIMTTHNKLLSKYFDKCFEIKDNTFKIVDKNN